MCIFILIPIHLSCVAIMLCVEVEAPDPASISAHAGRDLTVAAPFWAVSFRHGYSCLNSILIFDFFVPEVKSDLWIFFFIVLS